MGDPMTQIAADRMEGCLCAFDMRLIELRRNNALKQAALARLKLMRMEMERCEADKQRADRAYKKRLEDFYETDMRTRRARDQREGRESFANFLIAWQLMQQALAYTNHRLRIANSFAKASMTDDFAGRAPLSA
jgi:hypothetical protein